MGSRARARSWTRRPTTKRVGEAPKPEDFSPGNVHDHQRHLGDNKKRQEVQVLDGIGARVDRCGEQGGNFLLNVGPSPEGTIQPEFVERLTAIGEWLKVNGDSIYGTTYGRCNRSRLDA